MRSVSGEWCEEGLGEWCEESGPLARVENSKRVQLREKVQENIVEVQRRGP